MVRVSPTFNVTDDGLKDIPWLVWIVEVSEDDDCCWTVMYKVVQPAFEAHMIILVVPGFEPFTTTLDPETAPEAVDGFELL